MGFENVFSFAPMVTGIDDTVYQPIASKGYDFGHARIQMIQLKRVYEKPEPRDGARILVERLWPRGLRKDEVQMDSWQKEAAPTSPLRKWFSHDAAKWTEFQRRYFAELEKQPEVWEPILKAAKHGAVTLLYSSHDTEHNNAVALKRYLEEKLGR
jgi:uncharacterized protein YeaO (DUF488 family)